jgi:adenylate cyclase
MRENMAMTWAERDLAAYLGAAGRIDEAHAAVKRLLASHPEASLARADKSLPFMHDGLKRRFLDGLRKAGLPE